jgi:hypothetical protein
MGRTRVARHPEEGFVDFEQRLIDRLVSRAAQDQLVRVGVLIDCVGIVGGLLDDERTASGSHDAEFDIVGWLES